MKLTVSCPRGQYGPGMAIYCDKDGQPCAHQYYKTCKGWFVLSDGAGKCPLRKEQTDGQGRTAAAGRDDAV